MFSSSSFPRPAAMAGRLGSHLLLSLGIATAAASLVTLPRLLSREGGPALAPLPQASPLSLMAVADGKITDRLGWAGAEGEGDASAALHFTPAAFAMPMALGWQERDDRLPQQAASPARPEHARREQAAAPLPPRRVAMVTERMAAPLVILPPAAMASAEPSAASEENLGGRPGGAWWRRRRRGSSTPCRTWRVPCRRPDPGRCRRRRACCRAGDARQSLRL